MKFILSDHIALRSWLLVPYAYYVKGSLKANGLKREEYELAKRCDGTEEIEDSELVEELVRRGLIREAKEGDSLSEWQKELVCANRYFPSINWMITGKCNYNCRHCFNASDNNRLQSEFSYEEAERLIEDAQRCGINAYTITGGEPFLHPDFIRIIRSIYEHGMYVEELNTNGHFITQDILDEMKDIGCFPLMKISFDGIGHHDWLRNREGAEQDALKAIKLCIDNGFEVMAQTNVHRLNYETMLPTAKLLNEMGVSKMRIIRTSESPRWLSNSDNACLTYEEYFDRMLQFLEEYAQTGCFMEVDIWNFAHLWPGAKMYCPTAVMCAEGKYRDTLPVCKSNRGMVAIGANGNLYPCHQLSGYYEQHGWFLGNVKKDGLQKYLVDGEYMRTVCTTLKDLKEHNDKCAGCKWFEYCGGGCRALGVSLSEDVYGADCSKCLFFEGGYLDKLESVLPGYRNNLNTGKQ